MSNHAQGFESTQTGSGEYLFEVHDSKDEVNYGATE